VPVLAALDVAALLLALAAIISAVGGVGSTIMALRKSQGEEQQNCLDRLKEARAEAERLAVELHALKMAEAAPDEE